MTTESSGEPLILYGAAEIAAFLGLPLKVTQHRIDRGQIPTFRLGRKICARPAKLREWIASLDGREEEDGDVE